MANSERIIGLESDGSVPVTIVSGGGTGGTASSFGAAFPATGTAAGFIDSGGNMAGANLDASGFLKVNVAAGSGGNGAASNTGAAVPAQADYQGINVAGTLRGVTGVNPSGSIFAAQNDLTSIASTTVVGAGVSGTLAVGGSAATNVAIGTNPINNGAQGVSSENGAVTTGRMVQLVADLVGKLIVLPYANPENFVSGAITTAMTGVTGVSLIAAPATGVRNYITQVTVSNSHATVGTDVVITDGVSGATIYTFPAAAVYGGATASFPTPLRQPTTATALFAANVTTGASVKISASGYKGI